MDCGCNKENDLRGRLSRDRAIWGTEIEQGPLRNSSGVMTGLPFYLLARGLGRGVLRRDPAGSSTPIARAHSSRRETPLQATLSSEPNVQAKHGNRLDLTSQVGIAITQDGDRSKGLSQTRAPHCMGSVPDCGVTSSVTIDIDATLATFRVKEIKEDKGGQVVREGLQIGVGVGGVGVTWCVTPVVDLGCAATCACPSHVQRFGWSTKMIMPEVCRTSIVAGVAVGVGVPDPVKAKKYYRLLKLLRLIIEHGDKVINASAVLAAMVDAFGVDAIKGAVEEMVKVALDALRMLANAICKMHFEGMLLGGLEPCPCVPV